jgi:hypothetical protein
MEHFSFSDLNIWAIVVASVLNMVIGAFWYSRVFLGVPWMKSLGLKEEDLQGSPLKFVIVFFLGAIIAVLMAMFLQGVDSAITGLAYGAVISLGLVIPTMVTHYLFEMRKPALIFIVAGHELVLFLVYGALLGGWQ